MRVVGEPVGEKRPTWKLGSHNQVTAVEAGLWTPVCVIVLYEV
jgi:hypothetical protein